MSSANRLATMRTGVIAGAAGGLAEIAWVTLYAAITGTDPAVVARGVTTAAGLNAFLPNMPVTIGIGVHMTLAVLLGIALTAIWKSSIAKESRSTNPYPFMLSVLLDVWVINFMVVLPLVSSSFVHLLPYAVSLTSKLLFGVAAAEIVRNDAAFAVPQFAVLQFKSPSEKRSRV
jgi:hypothetical protein